MAVTPNDFVRVKLTEHGRMVLRRKHEELRAFARVPAAMLGDGVPHEDEHGWSKWNLWWLIEAFGGDVRAGSPFPFDDFEIVATNRAADASEEISLMDRKEVFEVVSAERVYQDRKWGTPDERPHEVGGYILLMEKLLLDAKTAWATQPSDHDALDEIRKAVAVGVACMEQHGAVPRAPSAFAALQGGVRHVVG